MDCLACWATLPEKNSADPKHATGVVNRATLIQLPFYWSDLSLLPEEGPHHSSVSIQETPLASSQASGCSGDKLRCGEEHHTFPGIAHVYD